MMVSSGFLHKPLDYLFENLRFGFHFCFAKRLKSECVLPGAKSVNNFFPHIFCFAVFCGGQSKVGSNAKKHQVFVLNLHLEH